MSAASSVPPATVAQSLETGPAAPTEVVQRLLPVADEAERRRILTESLATCGADALLKALKAESERQWAVDPHASLRLAEALILGAQIARLPNHEALGLMAKGDALRFIGHYPQSAEFLERAARAFEEQGDDVGWARTRIGWLLTLAWLGRGAEALANVPRAREILTHHEEWFRAASLDKNNAIVLKGIGRLEEAGELYERAQETFERLGEAAETQVAWTKTGQALVLTLQGRFPEALALHQQTRLVFQQRGIVVSAMRNDQNVAYIYSGQGHYTRALGLLSDALEAAEKAELSGEAALIVLDMVDCYLGINAITEALAHAVDAAERFAECGMVTERGRARVYEALSSARLGDVTRAMTALEDAARTFAGSGHAADLAIVDLLRAGLLLDASDWPGALDHAARAGASFAEQRQAVREAQAHLTRARALLGLGSSLSAEFHARLALATARERDVEWLAHESHHVLATAAATRGDDVTALAEHERAIVSIERVQSRQASELRTNFLADKLSVYHDAIDCALRSGDRERAFDYLERAKSRALVDYLASNPAVRLRARQPANQPLFDKLARLREEHNWFFTRLYGRGPHTVGTGRATRVRDPHPRSRDPRTRSPHRAPRRAPRPAPGSRSGRCRRAAGRAPNRVAHAGAWHCAP